ncbi:MAG TPA: arginase family protein [Steroidobacteraceae bacterium]|nr:arginase family protein [Steroidobacteraceae bacterium]
MTHQTQDRRYVILEAPSTFGLRSTGVEQLPNALLSHGLAERLSAIHAGRVEAASRGGQRDPQTTVLNGSEITHYTYRLADALGPLLNAGGFPIVLGGDCSIVLGSALALRRRGRYGMLFIDGQADFFQPEAEPNGEAASMDLAFVTGFGPRSLTHFDGRAPLIQPGDVVAFGFRDAEDQAEYGSQPLPAELRAFDLPSIQRMGVEAAAEAAIRHLARPELNGFWIHVDADCLDDAVMPAVDFRLPGGLSPDELSTVLTKALSSGRAMGIEVTIYNPTLDPERRAGKLLADLLADALTA